MKIKFKLILANLLMLTVSAAAQLPPQFSANDVFSIYDKSKSVKQTSLLLQNTERNLRAFGAMNNPAFSNQLPFNKFSANCDDTDSPLSPEAAPCNGVSVTSISFSNTGRTIVSGANNTVGVVYRYPSVGTAPDGTLLDALVTVVSYNNNQDSSPTTFRDADLVPGTGNIGFDGNLQPSLEQESNVHTTAVPWTGAITYRIQFVRAGTTTPKIISVAATTIDNDGSGACGGLRESVSYSSALNQTLTSNSTNQTLINPPGNKFTGPQAVQNGIATGIDYANAALYVNVSELNWTYSFQSIGNCAVNGASEDRFGSLNLSCQINFGKNFLSVAVSGNVFNDVDGLIDNLVDGAGTNAGGLFANLLDVNGNVVSSVAVAASGAYTFPVVVAGNYNVQISTNPGVESNPAPVSALPTGWVNTGEHIGTGTGSDGTVNGLLPITVAIDAIADVNFGIEQRPVAINNTGATQTNPGGTNTAAVPATTFTPTDTNPGIVSSIRITEFPSNTTTISINGTPYNSTNFPVGGVTVPTNSTGNPTQVILVDPFDGAVTVGIKYVAIDNAGVVSTATATASVPFVTVSISGAVLNDVNGLTDSIVNGTGTNAGGPLYANLLNSSNVVVQSMLLPSSGAYSFNNLNVGSYTVQVSTVQGTVGNAAPARNLPSGWVNTGEFIGTGIGNDGSVNGLLPVSIGTTAVSITNANLGIEQRPAANNNSVASQTNPGGTNRVTVPATTFSGSDLSGGTLASIRVTEFPSNATSLTIGTTTYYPNAGTVPAVCPTATCLAFPASGVTTSTNTSGNPTQIVQVDPINGAVTVVISYVTIDNANVESAVAATASVPLGTVSLSGTVFNDVNGLTDTPATVNGTGTNAGGGLFANLLDASNNVAATATVAADGSYSLSGLSSGSYTVQISTNQGTVGNAAPATVLPTSWVNTGENFGAGSGSDGAVNGLLPVTVAAVSVTNANFGIEQRPVASNNTAVSQTNPGGTTSVTVPPTTFTATDTATVSSIRITAFPSNATTININGTPYNSTNFPVGGVTIPTNSSGNPSQPILVDPIDGAVTVVIRFVAIDNAGVVSSPDNSAATASVPFSLGTTAAGGEISGTLYFGGNPLRNALVVLFDTASGSKAFARTDENGDYFFKDREVGRTYVVQPLSSKYSFGSENSVVNLRDDAAGINFVAAAKKYQPRNDFDGDGRSDAAVFRPSDGNWYVVKSSDEQMSVFNFGSAADLPVPADFDGDGKTDYAVFRPSDGNWYIWQSKTQKLRVENFGLAGDKLVPSDFDGDGKADVAVYRNGNWYIRRSSDNAFESKNFGLNADIPVTEDFDGDGRTDLTVYRPSDGNWYSLRSLDNSFSAKNFGLSTDVPVSGDFDGDGFADVAQFRNGNWYVLNSTTGFESMQLGFGKDKSIVGDYDGDGRADYVAFRNGIWSIRYSSTGAVRKISFGLATDVLVK